MDSYLRVSALILIAGLALAPGELAGQLAPPAREAGLRVGWLWGRVVDAQTQQPIAAAEVRLRELGRSELSHPDGTFHFSRLVPGSYTVVAQRIGYAPVEAAVRVANGDTARITLTLTPSAIDIAGVVVTGTGGERGAREAYRPTTVLDDAELRRELSASIAATLAGEPGIAQRYNGPAAAQPVIRGLSGDRVLVLEDGERTGDIATTGADHAVAVEPLTAERIEVVRGPAALLYGSNALGGVINVIREEVPRTQPEDLTGMLSAQAESVNRGLTAGMSVLAPAGPFALRAELSGRTAGDTRTPLGTLPNTELDGYNAGLGGSWVHDRGFIGAAVRDYVSHYGVPGTFNDQTIPGAHPEGVQIELHRTATRLEAGLTPGAGPFSSIDVTGNFVRYYQGEIEGEGEVGTEFGQLTGTINLLARHRHAAGGLRSNGALGLWTLWRDLNVAGSSTGSRSARQTGLAGFAFEEIRWGAFRLQGGLRYDWTRITPKSDEPGAFGDARRRDFGAVSGSVAALLNAPGGWVLGASVARAFRTPTIEELYSNGPHLADYSFNVGNSELEPEYGLGTDVFLRLNRPHISGELAVFRNRIHDYIYYALLTDADGDTIYDPRLGRFPVYQATQDDAVLVGAEARLQWEVIPGLVADGRTSYVRGTREADDVPLPAIPPLQGGLDIRYDQQGYFLSLGWEGAVEQDRVSDFEMPTNAYSLWNVGAGLRWTLGGRLHTLTLQVHNVLDDAWRDHLSRIKAVAPQPGRNIQLLYRVGF